MTAKRWRLVRRRRSLGFTQESLAHRLGVDRSTVVRWESGESDPQPWARPMIARALQVSLEELDALLAEQEVSRGDSSGGQTAPAIDDMNRRELLGLFCISGTLLALPSLEAGLDLDRLAWAASRPGRLDPAVLDEYAQLNESLWRVFSLATSKREVLPMVRDQLDVLMEAMRESHEGAVRRRLCALAADLFQLAGEVFFDGDRYTDAAHSYTLASSAAKEAGAFDLWACALTRHSFVTLYERRFAQAASMLALAAPLARRGDPALSTRYWVAAVQAEAFAGLGDLDSCERALEAAERVSDLPGPVHNGGWLRFDGSRLAEERGTCLLGLGRSDLAEAALTTALGGPLSVRRRASVQVDLAVIGAQRRDPDRVLAFAGEAVTAARQTGSGVISHKLRALHPHLAPLLGDRRVRRLSDDIAALV